MTPHSSTQLPRRTLAVSLAIASLGIFLSAQQVVGYVLETAGSWNLDGTSKPLSAGQQLPGGGLLGNAVPADGDHIIIANLRGEIIKTVRCRAAVCNECRASGNCYDPIQPLPATNEQTGVLAATFEAVMDLFSSKPDRYSIHRVRGGTSSSDPQSGTFISEATPRTFTLDADGVTPLAETGVDLSGVLKSLEKGSYAVQFSSVSRTGPTCRDWTSDEVPLTWNPERPTSVNIAGISPGLYQLTLMHKQYSGTAWLLLCGPDEYARASDEYQRAEAQVRQWHDAVSPETKRSYLRAYLEYLASHGRTTGN